MGLMFQVLVRLMVLINPKPYKFFSNKNINMRNIKKINPKLLLFIVVLSLWIVSLTLCSMFDEEQIIVNISSHNESYKKINISNINNISMIDNQSQIFRKQTKLINQS